MVSPTRENRLTKYSGCSKTRISAAFLSFQFDIAHLSFPRVCESRSRQRKSKLQNETRNERGGISSLTKVSRSRNCFPTKLRFGGSFFSFLFSSSCSSSFANLQTRDRSSLSSSSLALNQSPTRNPIALTAASASATLMIRAASARESRPRGLVVDFCVRGN